jgi:hypothetical protein
MEDIECNKQTLIDMKEWYQRDVEAFTKMTQLACILGVIWTTQMEVGLVCIQAKYCND